MPMSKMRLRPPRTLLRPRPKCPTADRRPPSASPPFESKGHRSRYNPKRPPQTKITSTNTQTVDKWADYEDEIQHLRAQAQPPSAQSPSPQPDQQQQRSDSPSRFSSYLPVQNRLSSFLSSRKSTQNLQTPTQPPPSPSATELVAALTREQALRQAAEGKLDEASGELEDLTAQLFQQANEMVATERKARAKLEERVEVLERRDGEKRKRLERLEGAVQRIERVRGLLAPGR